MPESLSSGRLCAPTLAAIAAALPPVGEQWAPWGGPAALMGGAASYEVFEVRRQAAEYRAPHDEQQQCDDDRNRIGPLERELSVEERIAQASHEPRERIGCDPWAQRLGNERERIEDGRQVHQDH